MCLILFAYKKHPEYDLIVAANRDEFYNRPTAPVHFWEDEPEILAGRDLEKMGTWMGITTSGRFAALTNFRNPAEITDGKRTRGEITTAALKHKGNMLDFMQQLSEKDDLYTGYNLIAGDIRQLYYYSNISRSLEELEPGFYGLSNALLNTPWPKVVKGKSQLEKIFAKQPHDFIEELFTMLQNDERAPDEFLPKTGMTLEWERILSPLFIKSDTYGTRSSAVLLMSNDKAYLQERTYSSDGFSKKEFELEIQGK